MVPLRDVIYKDSMSGKVGKAFTASLKPSSCHPPQSDSDIVCVLLMDADGEPFHAFPENLEIA